MRFSIPEIEIDEKGYETTKRKKHHPKKSEPNIFTEYVELT
jgi:hypothetical protein